MSQYNPKTRLTEAQFNYIRDRAGKEPDEVIAKALGFHPRKVLYCRTKNGWPRYVAPHPWSAEVTAQCYDLYIVQGLPSSKVGELIGTTADQVRRKAHRMGWKRDAGARKTNQKIAQWRRWHGPEAQPRSAPEAKPALLRGANDAALIADFIAKRGVTVVPPGVACGLSGLEMQFGAYRPNAGWIEQQVIGKRDAEKRRRVA